MVQVKGGMIYVFINCLLLSWGWISLYFSMHMMMLGMSFVEWSVGIVNCLLIVTRIESGWHLWCKARKIVMRNSDYFKTIMATFFALNRQLVLKVWHPETGQKISLRSQLFWFLYIFQNSF